MNPDRARRWVIGLASAACVGASLLVFGLRADAVATATRTVPGVAVTSGFEEESWFALWRFAHGQPVFADATRAPFAGAYFNWLFYGAYGGVAKAAADRLGDAAIPSAGRILTGIFALAGAVALAMGLRRVGDPATNVALAAFALTGPLVGWWSLTVRPDVAALAFEVLGFALFLRAVGPARSIWLCAAAGAFFAAWSFKQVYAFGFSAALACLAWRREWRSAALLAALFVALAGASLLLGGEAYRAALSHTAVVNDFYPLHGLRTLGAAVAKAGPLWVIPVFLLVRGRTLGQAAWALHPVCAQLAWIGLGVTLAGGTLLSCKLGASTNYFFSTLPFLAALNALGLRAAASVRLALLPLGLIAAVQLATAAGVVGSTSLAAQAERLARLWTEWRAYPEPRFSSHTAFNLPWLSPQSPPLITAFNYWLQRRDSVPFEGAGIGGMISRGEFEALMLPAHQAGGFDGASMEHYVAEREVSGFVFLRKKSPP